jgi:hypothetical protein
LTFDERKTFYSVWSRDCLKLKIVGIEGAVQLCQRIIGILLFFADRTRLSQRLRQLVQPVQHHLEVHLRHPGGPRRPHLPRDRPSGVQGEERRFERPLRVLRRTGQPDEGPTEEHLQEGPEVLVAPAPHQRDDPVRLRRRAQPGQRQDLPSDVESDSRRQPRPLAGVVRRTGESHRRDRQP